MTHDWAVRVPATSANLGPGFDVLGIAMTRHLVVGSRDRVGSEPRVTMVGLDADDVPTGDDNLLWTSFVRGCDAFDVAVPDLALRVNNRIPLERGMGSSSSAIVAGLALARCLADGPVSDVDLVELADGIEGHPDNVAPAVLGGVVAATRRDDGSLALRRAQPDASKRLVLHVPTDRQLTSDARTVLPEALSRADVATQVGRTAFVVGGLTGTWPMDAGVVGDRLHEPARLAGLPASAALLDDLRARGVPAWLSGSGPTVASLVSKREDVVDHVDDDGHAVIVVDVDLAGVVACPATGCAFAFDGDCGSCPHRRL